jgi:transcriptional regulator with XRE-family HTH domain
MNITPPVPGVSFSLEGVATLRKAEAAIQEKMKAAEREYLRKSLYLRERIGHQMQHLRTSAGISRAQMAEAMGLPVKSSNGVLGIVEQPTAQKSYGVEAMLDFAEQYCSAIAKGVQKETKVSLRHRVEEQKFEAWAESDGYENYPPYLRSYMWEAWKAGRAAK